MMVGTQNTPSIMGNLNVVWSWVVSIVFLAKLRDQLHGEGSPGLRARDFSESKLFSFARTKV